MDRLEVIGVIVGTAVAVFLGYVEVLRRSFAKNGSGASTPFTERGIKCMDNVAAELSEMRKVLHTNTRVMDDLRREISQFRVELAEVKGRLD